MTRITRRRLLGGAAAASLSVPLPEAAAGMDDLTIVRMLIDAHKAAIARWSDLPEIWSDQAAVAMWEKLSAEKNEAAEALCFYRPTSLEGVHAKAEYMVGCGDFVDQEANDDWTREELISGFLPAGKDLKPWTEKES
ncbi:hypothetical protein ELH24_09235 [Rhizobium ruizarguesonis]|uniref:hypothetical protein n=1 Tax=Rhizobium ruizarguesonis TaxID=2081791 RepID=UPI00102F3F65|nr:hypothetical protein [Rhizobium ruizarguesonis]TBD15700.1 hypothetical protein ELH24_09235 [Rhizobium ruizarguesonis]